MLIGKIHPGSGLGDQLFSYIITRIIALDKGYDFGFVGKEYFKGTGFMNLDWGLNLESAKYFIEQPSGKLILDQPIEKIFEFNKPYYDPEVNFIEDNTIIDGTGAQSEQYWNKYLDQILGWLKVKPELFSGFYDEICVIGYRGGEYKYVPELYLTEVYWDKAIKEIKKIKPDCYFKVVTDDPEEAKRVFPDFEVSHEIGDDWTSALLAHYLIIPNSAFFILPALLNQNAKKIIAPRRWANYNAYNGEWKRPQNYYHKFTYI